MKRLFAFLLFALSSLHAAVQTETVTYKDGDQVLEGFVAWDDAVKGQRPGVLVVHDWTGLQDYAKNRAKMLAEMGYVAFAADIYGKDVRPVDPKECAVCAGKYKNDLPLLRSRVIAAVEQLKVRKETDASRLGAIGYCYRMLCAAEFLQLFFQNTNFGSHDELLMIKNGSYVLINLRTKPFGLGLETSERNIARQDFLQIFEW